MSIGGGGGGDLGVCLGGLCCSRNDDGFGRGGSSSLDMGTTTTDGCVVMACDKSHPMPKRMASTKTARPLTIVTVLVFRRLLHGLRITCRRGLPKENMVMMMMIMNKNGFYFVLWWYGTKTISISLIPCLVVVVVV